MNSLVLRAILPLCLFLMMQSNLSGATFPVTNLNNTGAGSLRQAITNANSSAGSDIITFTVSGTINLTFALPGISGPVTIDGTTAPGYVCGAPTVSVNGGGGSGNGLQFLGGASGSSVLGINVRSFQFNGIQFIGASNVTVQGCFIGTNLAGTAAQANGQNGIQIEGGSNNFQIGGSTICERNVISGNSGTGIASITSINGQISGNYIGVNAAGTAGIGNRVHGIYLFASTTTQIGGTGALEGNVIGDHDFHGVIVDGGSNGTFLYGNRIGTNAAGTAAIGNDDSGVIVINSSGIIIGGSAAGQGNLFSGSVTENGIYLTNGDNCVIRGNFIGTDITGLSGLPNFVGGIVIENGSTGNTIGGSGAGEGNVIAFNTGYGVSVETASDNQNLISRNSMFCNTGSGIALNGLGNGNNPAPIITTLTTTGVAGTADANNIIELFYDSTCTASCQGKDFIASVTANGTGNWSYTGPLVNGATVVATATDVAPAANVNNTSEFACSILLPVEGLTFSGRRIAADRVYLEWKTTLEIDNHYFAVERSTDGFEFEQIGRIFGDPSGNAGKQYQFTDPNASAAKLYYRLKQVDLDGSVNFGDVIQIASAADLPEIRLYDHPSPGVLRLSVSNVFNEVVQGELRDSQGRVVKAFQMNLEQGSPHAISTSDLAPGVYHLSIVTRDQRISKQVMVL